MAEQLTGVKMINSDERTSRQRSMLIHFAKLAPTGPVTMLLLGIEGAFAICVCGDGLCNTPSPEGGTCLPQETSVTCPEDCGGIDLPPTELTVRVFVVPFGDSGLFNLRVDDTTLKTNVPNGGGTGPHTLTGGAHTLSETAGAGTELVDYSKTICGACSASGAIQEGTRQICSITNLRLPEPPPAPGCGPACLSDFLQCGAAGEESDEFCRDAFLRCNNRCHISSGQRFSITRYTRPGMPSVNLTEADADGILAGMSNVLRGFDGGVDLECNVSFCRGGGITEYAIGDGMIDYQVELDAVFALPERVKVARSIDFCDAECDPMTGGCARGESFIVQRSPDEAAIWAHEYGHNRGLEHREDPSAVMNPTLSSTTRGVNSRECIAYHGSGLGQLIGVAMPVSASAGATKAVTAPLADVRDFVRQIFIHGIPYDEFMKYGSAVVPTLLEMLADPGEERAWPNILIMLGMLGDDRVVTPLISFIEQDPGGKLNYYQYEAKKNAVFALGYLVNRNGDQRALSYLINGLDPSAWMERRITWTSSEHESAAERNRELSRVTIIGLGLSGNPSAEEALRELLTPAPTAAGREFREQMSGVISEVLKANQRISEEGLATYYR